MRKLTSAQRYSYDYDNWYSDDAIICSEEDFGGTPLNAALVTTHHLVKQFTRRHSIEKMNLVILSDGDSQNLQVVRDRKLANHHADITGTYEGKMNAIIDGKKLKSMVEELVLQLIY
jgi:Mg-chelatase subunit ChlD